MEKIRKERQKEMKKVEARPNNIKKHCEVEWKRYMSVGDLEEKDCPLQWWKENENDFKSLSILARKFLAVQATSAPSERVFSHAALIISNRRNRLSSEMAGKLFYVSENIDWYEEQLRECF